MVSYKLNFLMYEGNTFEVGEFSTGAIEIGRYFFAFHEILGRSVSIIYGM